MSTSFPCAFSPWSYGIGDPHQAGWLIVVLYLVAAWACAKAARSVRVSLPAQRREQVFWWICAGLLALLAINKQLDLQTLLTSVARCMAQDQGWYENRREVQRSFIIVVTAVGVLVVATSMVLLRKTFARTGLSIVGLGFICTFVGIRAASFHHFDILLNHAILGLPTASALEIPGPVLIMAVAIRARSSKPT